MCRRWILFFTFYIRHESLALFIMRVKMESKSSPIYGTSCAPKGRRGLPMPSGVYQRPVWTGRGNGGGTQLDSSWEVVWPDTDGALLLPHAASWSLWELMNSTCTPPLCQAVTLWPFNSKTQVGYYIWVQSNDPLRLSGPVTPLLKITRTWESMWLQLSLPINFLRKVFSFFFLSPALMLLYTTKLSLSFCWTGRDLSSNEIHVF